jgi:hypothetical protein
MALGRIRDTQVNQGVTSLQSRKKTSKHGSRVMAGCTVEITYPHCAQVQAYLREVRSQFKRYKVQRHEVPSRAIREKVMGVCPRQEVLFGV